MGTVEFSQHVADLLMEQVLKVVALAGGDEAQRGGRYLFTLNGDVSGSYMVDLTPGHVDVARAKGGASDGRVAWTVGFADVAQTLEKGFAFTKARKAGQLVIDADRVSQVKLERALDAMSKVDVPACLRDPSKVIAERFLADTLGPSGDEKKTKKKKNVGVRVRK